jgi:hypothetical protein
VKLENKNEFLNLFTVIFTCQEYKKIRIKLPFEEKEKKQRQNELIFFFLRFTGFKYKHEEERRRGGIKGGRRGREPWY